MRTLRRGVNACEEGGEGFLISTLQVEKPRKVITELVRNPQNSLKKTHRVSGVVFTLLFLKLTVNFKTCLSLD